MAVDFTPEKILVIDDEEIVREITQRVLERAGFDVFTASNGREGLKFFEENLSEISLVLLDLTMPYVSGQEVFRRIRHLRADVPIVVMSGYNQQELSDQFSGNGLSGFLHKPFRPEMLLNQIATVLQAAA